MVMRGVRQAPIVHNDIDRWDFVKLLYYLNDSFIKRQWERDLSNGKCKLFERPSHWPEQDPLVNVCAFCLHDNHFHLLLKEIRDGGISLFMQRLPNCLSLRYNKKYEGVGTIFQGSYKSRRVQSDGDLINLGMYIMAKNVMERCPGGIHAATKNFEKAWKWALNDNFSSFADYASRRASPIIRKDALGELLPSPERFKEEVKQYLQNYQEREELLGGLALE